MLDAVVVAPVVDEEPQRNAHLRRREPDARGGGHRLLHVVHQRAQRRRRSSDRLARGMEDGVARDADRTNGHSARISGRQRVDSSGASRPDPIDVDSSDPRQHSGRHRHRPGRRGVPRARRAVPAPRRRARRGAARIGPQGGPERPAAPARWLAARGGCSAAAARSRHPLPAHQPRLRAAHRGAAARRGRARDHLDRERAGLAR